MLSEVIGYGVNDYELMLFLVTRSLFDANYELADSLICEFVYLIENLTPRSIQDLFYFVGLDTNGAYWTFFELAVERMGLETYKNHNKTSYGQRKGYPQQRIFEMLEQDWSLQEIYDTTCATKQMIRQAINLMVEREGGRGSKGERLVESIRLDLDLKYQREVYFDDFADVTGANFNGRYDFVVDLNSKVKRVIEFDGEQHFKFAEYYHENLRGI